MTESEAKERLKRMLVSHGGIALYEAWRWKQAVRDLLTAEPDDPFPTDFAKTMAEIEEPPPVCITFKPYESPRPTLDQMPEGERGKYWFDHLTNSVEYECFRVGDQVYYIGVDGAANRFGADPSKFELRTDPPTPKTLADVPKGVWCLNEHGVAVVHWQGRVVRATDSYPFSANAASTTITRVLGTPAVEGVG